MIAPLDIITMLVNVLSGTVNIFIGLSLFVIAILSAKFRLTSVAFGGIILLFSIVVFGLAGWLYAIAVIIIGMVLGYIMTRFVR